MMKGPLGQKIVPKENTKKKRIEDQIVAKQNSRFRWVWENANLQLARGPGGWRCLRPFDPCQARRPMVFP